MNEADDDGDLPYRATASSGTEHSSLIIRMLEVCPSNFSFYTVQSIPLIIVTLSHMIINLQLSQSHSLVSFT